MNVSELIEQKLKSLPSEPGVYFHKDAEGQIIYVGKAARLNNRVRQYFQKSRARDPKTTALVRDIVDIDYMVVDSEIEALFLESEMIRRYMPKYNILLRDDKAMSYIRIDYDSDYPTVSVTRRPLDDGAKYFGPYYSTYIIRQALRQLRRVFPYATKRPTKGARASLHYHLGLDPGLEEGRTSLEDYRANLRRLIAVIEGRTKTIDAELEREMNKLAKAQDFEAAARARNQLFALRRLKQKIIFSDKEFLDISKDHALSEIVDVLSIDKYPRRIEGYDISHMQGTDVVASMVVFTNGVSDKSEYRKFKTRKDHNNDFYNMNETIARRFSERNIKAWGKPDLVLIDGGKGQLDAAIKARDASDYKDVPFIGLAKREEQIVVAKDRSGIILNMLSIKKLKGYITESDDFILVNLPHSTNIVKLLQRIRDESHRFAITYHGTLKRARQTSSHLDDIPGVGPVTRRKLIKEFGSLRGVSQASEDALKTIVGENLAHAIWQSHHDAR